MVTSNDRFTPVKEHSALASIPALLSSWKGHKLFARRQQGFLMGLGGDAGDACLQHSEESEQLVIQNRAAQKAHQSVMEVAP